MDKLTEIMQAKRREVAAVARPVRDSELRRLGEKGSTCRRMADALRPPDGLAVLAEVKRRSPSAGLIAELPEAAEQARIYYNGGADGISVLTDQTYFGGSLRDLWDVSDLLNRRDDAPPLLRKDFFVHPVQVVEAAEAGAAAILVIVRALSDEEIESLSRSAALAGLEVIYEIHEERELERALAFEPEIIGVNNRDLTRFRTDLAISESLLPMIPHGIVRISESGIRDADDALRVRQAGADAVLVGESLMRSEDTEALLKSLREIA